MNKGDDKKIYIYMSTNLGSQIKEAPKRQFNGSETYQADKTDGASHI